MSTIADNFIKDGTFGRRLFAMIASFYAIALLYGQQSGAGTTRGYETVASALRSIGLDGVADWITNTLMATLHSSPIAPVAAAVVLAGAVLSMTATYRHTMYNVSPRAAFAFLFAICLLIDLGTLSLRSAAIATVVTAALVGIFCLLPSEDRVTPAPVVALLITLGPIGAIVYGPAKVVSWFVSESQPPTVRVKLERDTGPVEVTLVEGDGPRGARQA